MINAGEILPARCYGPLTLGSEFMSNLNEGTLFYMTTTPPGLSITKGTEAAADYSLSCGTRPEVDGALLEWIRAVLGWITLY